MSIPERAGWYDDPEDETQLRYFDGIIWSDRRVPRRSPGTQSAAPHDAASNASRNQPSRAQPPRNQASRTHSAPDQHAPGRPGTDVFGRPTAGRAPSPSKPGQPGGWGAPASTGPTTNDGQPLAGYGSRVGAFIIDVLILGVINLIAVGWAWWLWSADYWRFVWDAALANDPERIEGLTPAQLSGMLDWRYLFVAFGLSLLIMAIYHVGFLATRSATPGKMLLGLSVRRVDRAGPLGVGTAFMRTLLPLAVGVLSLAPILSYLLWLVWIADLLWPLRDPQRQALHDKIASTQVVRGKQPRGAAPFGN